MLVLTGCATSVGGTAVGPVPGAVPATERSSAPGSGPAPTAESSPPSPGRGGGTHTVSDLPVPIEFSLPDGWRSAPPGEVSADGAAFVALKPASISDGMTPSIVIVGDVQDSTVSLTEVADRSLAALRDRNLDVTVEDRRRSGSADNPGLTQVVGASGVINGKTQNTAQVQTFLGFSDTEDPQRRAILQFVLTVKAEQLETLAEDFQEFLSTVRPTDG
ncbi:hypothetical protein [Saccharomonospora iraqiensis]|uniref:hypothetical protein n=1 Tax=Saccharomonospora iraqiensis TaxID=52698 RepID=UPI001F2DF126|nr:hypothetical protein [Saccharomonospora iraqiensis]